MSFTLAAILILAVGSTAVQSVEARRTWHTTTLHVYAGESIQAALDSASASDTVIVHGGEYHQSVVITKSIRLVGDGAILDGSPPADDGTDLTSDAITIAASVSHVTIKGFEIRDYTFGIQAWNDGTSNINIIGNEIHDISEVAVSVGNDGTGFHRNWLINGNTIRTVGVGIYVAQGKGVMISNNVAEQAEWSGIWVGVEPDSALNSEMVTVTRNTVTTALVAGIYVLGGSEQAQVRRIAVTRNTVSHCVGDGIDLLRWPEQARPIEDAVVSHNTVDSNEGLGILLQGVARGLVSANTVTNHHYHSGIVVFDSSKITVMGNVARNNLDDGIEINFSNDNRVIGNTVNGNNWGIVVTEGSSRNLIMSNRAEGNMEYDLFDDGTGTRNVWRYNKYDTRNW